MTNPSLPCRGLRLFFVTLAPILALTSATRAQCIPQWSLGDAPAGASGTVNTSALWDPDGPGPIPERLVIGGGPLSSVNGTPAINIAMFDGQSWSPLGAGLDNDYSTASVYDLAVFGSDLISTGTFTRSASTPLPGIARWNGSAWQSIGQPPAAGGRSIAVYNGKLIVGGQHSLGGIPGYSPIIQWDGQSWQPIATGMHGDVYSLFVLNGFLYAGGTFAQTLGSLPVNTLARWDGTQWQDTGLTGAVVYSLGEFQGSLVAAGVSLRSGNNSLGSAAILNGQAWQGLGPGPAMSYSTSIAAFGGQLVIGGLSGSSRTISKWNGAIWTDLGAGLAGDINDLAVYQGRLTAVGTFRSSGWTPTDNGIAQWDGAAWSSMSSGLNGGITGLSIYRGALLSAGEFSGTGTSSARSCARWNGSNWESPGADVAGSIWSMLPFGDELIVTGYPIRPGGGSLGHVAHWDGQSWQMLGSGLPTLFPRTLGIYEGALIAAGNGLARWDGTAWQSFGGSIGSINSLATLNGELIAAGQFTSADGLPVNNIARWDGSAWHAMGAGISGGVQAMAVFNGVLIAATTSNYPSGHYLYSWDGASWTPMEAGLSYRVTSLLVSNGTLLAGTFGISQSDIGAVAKWNGAQWVSLDVPLRGVAISLAQRGSEVFAAGGFTINGRYSYLARLACPCYANCDGSTTSPILTFNDFSCFLNQFALGTPYPNCDGSTAPPALNANDFQCFLNAYAVGCP